MFVEIYGFPVPRLPITETLQIIYKMVTTAKGIYGIIFFLNVPSSSEIQSQINRNRGKTKAISLEKRAKIKVIIDPVKSRIWETPV